MENEVIDGGNEVVIPSENENLASAMGWSPKDKWRGDPEKWVDADEFVRRGEHNIPILNERLRKMEAALREKDEAFSEWKKFQEETNRQKEQELKNQIQDLKSRRAEAIRSGDGDMVNEIDDQIDSLKNKKVDESRMQQVSEVNKAIQAQAEKVAMEWVAKPDNKIFDTDPEVSAIAELQFRKLVEEGIITQTMIQNNPMIALEMMKRRTMEVLPTKFSNQNRNRAGSVEGGGQKVSSSALDEDGRKLLDKFKRNKAITTPEEEQDFIRNYVSRYGRQ